MPHLMKLALTDVKSRTTKQLQESLPSAQAMHPWID